MKKRYVLSKENRKVLRKKYDVSDLKVPPVHFDSVSLLHTRLLLQTSEPQVFTINGENKRIKVTEVFTLTHLYFLSTEKEKEKEIEE